MFRLLWVVLTLLFFSWICLAEHCVVLLSPQACRGDGLDDGVEADSVADTTECSFSQHQSLPVDAAVMYATAPGKHQSAHLGKGRVSDSRKTRSQTDLVHRPPQQAATENAGAAGPAALGRRSRRQKCLIKDGAVLLYPEGFTQQSSSGLTLSRVFNLCSAASCSAC